MSLPSLYELADEFKEALENLTDLDDQSVKDTLESLEGEFKLKTTNVAKYIKNLEHAASGIKEVESRQHKRRTSIESKIKHLKEYFETGQVTLLKKFENDPVKLFTKIYGVGPKKAEEFKRLGITTIQELKEKEDELNNELDEQIKVAWEKAMDDLYPNPDATLKYVYSGD